MNNAEIQSTLKVGDYGLLVFKGILWKGKIHAHGKVKYIDSNGTIVFKDNDSKLYTLSPEKIVSFTAKEMQPKPTEHKGKPIYWDAGRFYYTETKKECDINL